MIDLVREQPHQFADALWRVESAGIPAIDAPGGLTVCGMGGSAIGADLAAAAIGDRATRPLGTVRGYRLDPWLGEDTLVLCASYSGDTEETLACFEAAGAAGAPRVALTTGGRLAELARSEGVPVIGVPGGMQPRAAVVYMTVGALECAALCGAAPSLRGEIEATGALLAGLLDDPEPAAVAQALEGRVPIVYGAEATDPVAARWKTQINENAKRPAFRSTLPEADHNEICGFAAGGDFTLVFLEDAGQHERVRRRIELTAQVAEAAGLPVVRLQSRGQTPLERVMSLVLLGDLVSVQLAALDGTDPMPVDVLERFKQAL
ncbi:MAG: bifunctional phosphoglucose/phosphomannose isomerase [Thermoleophilaceae bacterium]